MEYNQIPAVQPSSSVVEQAILDSANYTIISTALDGTILTFNKAAERLLGYSASEVVGQTTPLIFHDREEVAQRAKDLSKELGVEIEPGFDVFIAKTDGYKSEEREWSYLRKDGSRFPVLLSVTILRDAEGKMVGFLGIGSDLTDRKQAEKALYQREQEFKALVENAPDVIVRLDRELRHLYINPVVEKESGIPTSAFFGKTKQELGFPEEPTSRIDAATRVVFDTGKEESIEVFFPEENGGKYYHIRIAPDFSADGTIESVFCICRNITQLKETEITLQKVNEDLELRVQKRTLELRQSMAKLEVEINHRQQTEQALKKAKDELEMRVQERTRELSEANAALQTEIADRLQAQRQLEILTKDLQRSNQELEQFAYIASHDLQEPLRAITSYTQMLVKRYRGQLDAKADTYIDFIIDGAARMRQLIQDLLAYSRVGRRELKFQLTDCQVLLGQVLQDLQIAIADSQASVICGTLPSLMADTAQIRLLFQNLISNALKYRSETPPQITVSAVQEDNSWLFAIEDNGIGIEPEYAERIFVIFQRLHTSDEYSGTGLGLAICKKIVERHGGEIWVESPAGKGATFYFTIPIIVENKNE